MIQLFYLIFLDQFVTIGQLVMIGRLVMTDPLVMIDRLVMIGQLVTIDPLVTIGRLVTTVVTATEVGDHLLETAIEAADHLWIHELLARVADQGAVKVADPVVLAVVTVIPLQNWIPNHLVRIILYLHLKNPCF